MFAKSGRSFLWLIFIVGAISSWNSARVLRYENYSTVEIVYNEGTTAATPNNDDHVENKYTNNDVEKNNEDNYVEKHNKNNHMEENNKNNHVEENNKNNHVEENNKNEHVEKDKRNNGIETYEEKFTTAATPNNDYHVEKKNRNNHVENNNTNNYVENNNKNNHGEKNNENNHVEENNKNNTLEKNKKNNHVEMKNKKKRIETYEEKFARLTVADPDQRTLAFANIRFYSGFCNVVMAFTTLIMWAHDNNFTQVLLPSLIWRDLFGTNHLIPHEKLFDVVHWNEYYASFNSAHYLDHGPNKPPLPRLVVHHPSMIHFDKRGEWLIDHLNATHPYAYGSNQRRLFKDYIKYNERVAWYGRERHPSDLAIMQGVFRPHPDLQRMIQDYKSSHLSASNALLPEPSSSSSSSSRNHGGYMCFHPRIEPDMQFHETCGGQKVKSLEDILHSIYQEFPTAPPFDRILIVLNRPLLERKAKTTDNELTRRNLVVLNELRDHGMWNGTVRVHEAGTNTLPEESFFRKQAPSLSGSILNYHLALEADIFIGTPISSWSMFLMKVRYNRNLTENYMYLPSGLVKVNSSREPPPFNC